VAQANLVLDCVVEVGAFAFFLLAGEGEGQESAARGAFVVAVVGGGDRGGWRGLG